ncbi:MAG: LacI family transcriptional regulator [Clostridiales bacterium]|nr:LacI family transcriptional regulator [Clostridiales bacterium]
MAGVGKATVSIVINNSGYVKEETREKILKISFRRTTQDEN